MSLTVRLEIDEVALAPAACEAAADLVDMSSADTADNDGSVVEFDVDTDDLDEARELAGQVLAHLDSSGIEASIDSIV